MCDERIANLLERKEILKRERKEYQGWLQTAQRGLSSIDVQLEAIEQELQGSFKGRNQYSHADVMEARQGINQVLSGRGMTVGELHQELPFIDKYLLERELKKLSNNHASPVMWNGKRGVASKYYRRMAA